MIRASEVKLGMAPKPEAMLDSALWIMRTLYNAALEQRITAYRSAQRHSLTFYDQCKELTSLRASDETYRALNAEMTRGTVLHRLDKAFKGFFGRLKSGVTAGFPRFKGRDRFSTIVFTTQGWECDGTRLTLTGIPGKPSFRMNGEIHRDGPCRGLRLVKKAGRWYAQFLIDIGEAPAVKAASNPVGIDVGLQTFATMSDGRTIPHPRLLKKSLMELATAQRALSSKRKGSKRRMKAKARLATVHLRIANRRKDFIRKEVCSLVKRYDGFAVEKLDIKGLAEKEGPQERALHRGIMDSAWGMFFAQLTSKAAEAAMEVREVNPRGTSQRCSGCGSIVKKGLWARVHRCFACGLVLDRDHNAAINIYDLGFRSAGDALPAEVSS